MIDYELVVEKKFVELDRKPNGLWEVVKTEFQLAATFDGSLEMINMYHRIHRYKLHTHDWVTYFYDSKTPNVLRVKIQADDEIDAKLAFHTTLHAYLVGEVY